MANGICRAVCLCCGLWMLLYALVGSTATGKAFFGQFLEDKASAPLFALVLPVLLSGTVCSLLALRTPEFDPSSRTSRTRQEPSLLRRIFQSCGGGVSGKGGDPNFSWWGIAYIVIPCSVFAACGIYRHLHGQLDSLSTAYKVMEIGNAFGLAALVALSVLLVPVARHSAILQTFGWNSPAAAVCLHMWTGRFVMAAVFVHGGMHMIKWHLQGESIVGLLIPPRACWSLDDQSDYYVPTCQNEDSDCTCYHHFRNLTGLTAGIGLAVIAISSLNVVRRSLYSVFYKIHIVAGPTVLFFTIAHWSRSIMYIGGGALYYTACSFPVLAESFRKRRLGDCTRIVSVEQIKGKRRHCMAVTVAASEVALSRFRAGQYTFLRVPAISSIAHPFSVNTCPTDPRYLRIVFRCTGPFTTKLAEHFTEALRRNTQTLQCDDDGSSDVNVPVMTPPIRLPQIYLEGFFGSPDRVQQVLQHDVVVMVAAGIGITPYLSLLHRVHALSRGSFTHKVILLWICRDPALIDYMKREYFVPLLEQQHQQSNNKRTIQIIIHQTGIIDGRNSNVQHVTSSSDLDNPQDDHDSQQSTPATSLMVPPSLQQGVPFAPSRYSPGSKNTYKGNDASFVTFIAIAWIGLAAILYFYFNVKTDHQTLDRIWSPLVVVALGTVVSVTINCWVSNEHCGNEDDSDTPETTEWTPIMSSFDEEDETTECSVEMGDMSSVLSFSKKNMSTSLARKSTPADVLDNPYDSIVLEEREGRPTVHQFINYLDEAEHPGLFACGPVSLLDDIRAATKERCLLRFRQCVRGEPHIALYEESFEM